MSIPANDGQTNCNTLNSAPAAPTQPAADTQPAAVSAKGSEKRMLLPKQIVTAFVAFLLMAVMLTCFCQPKLSAVEKKLLGTWTLKDKPGDYIVQFRPDLTMRASVQTMETVSSARWYTRNNCLFFSADMHPISHVWRKFIMRAPPYNTPFYFSKTGELHFSHMTLVRCSDELARKVSTAE